MLKRKIIAKANIFKISRWENCRNSLFLWRIMNPARSLCCNCTRMNHRSTTINVLSLSASTKHMVLSLCNQTFPWNVSSERKLKMIFLIVITGIISFCPLVRKQKRMKKKPLRSAKSFRQEGNLVMTSVKTQR